MGFLDGLGRMIAGKPVFDDASQSAQQTNTSASTPVVHSGLRDESGRKIIPDITVKNLKARRNGDQMSVTAWVTNESNHRVRIDTVHLLEKRQINQELNPQQSRELKLYEGSVARDDREHDAQIIYRIQENGDLFQTDYVIEYNRESDGTMTIEELHEEGEVRDI